MNKYYFSVNNWLLDTPSGSILHLTSGERKRLGEYQLKLLEVFIQHAGTILTREELTQLVWERRVIGNNSLPNAIHALRSALEDDGKQQKIIKTIPKKGYLLESEYCCSIIKEENEVSERHNDPIIPPNGAGLTPDESSGAGPALPAEIERVAEPKCVSPEVIENQTPDIISTSHLVPIQRYRRLFTALIAIILLALIGFSCMWYFFKEQRNRLMAQEQESGAYSNIRIYRLAPTSLPALNQESLYNKLKDTLYQLNQILKAQSINMNVYYMSNGAVLNYTFSLVNQCDNKQLAMEIYHWRIDPQQLNNLISRETKRKLNEMEVCSSE